MSKTQKRGELSQKMQREIQKIISEGLPKIRVVKGLGFFKSRKRKERKEISDQQVVLDDNVSATLLDWLFIYYDKVY